MPHLISLSVGAADTPGEFTSPDGGRAAHTAPKVGPKPRTSYSRSPRNGPSSDRGPRLIRGEGWECRCSPELEGAAPQIRKLSSSSPGPAVRDSHSVVITGDKGPQGLRFLVFLWKLPIKYIYGELLIVHCWQKLRSF